MDKLYAVKVYMEFDDGYMEEVLGIFTNLAEAMSAVEGTDAREHFYNTIDICEVHVGTLNNFLGKPIMSYAARSHRRYDEPRQWTYYSQQQV